MEGRAEKEFICVMCSKKVPESHRSSSDPCTTCDELNEKTLVIPQEPWYIMADSQEVFNMLNALAMTFEKFHLFNEATYGDAEWLYDFDENTFFKAEQLWAQKEGLC